MFDVMYCRADGIAEVMFDVYLGMSNGEMKHACITIHTLMNMPSSLRQSQQNTRLRCTAFVCVSSARYRAQVNQPTISSMLTRQLSY